MRACFLAVGSELLGTERLDTNSLRAARLLQLHGVELARKAVVGDSLTALRRELEQAAKDHELVLVSGGLGPTADDLTRDAAAAAYGRLLRLEPAIVHDIEEKFRSFGREMPSVNRRQAMVLEGAEILWNPLGTAPGLRLDHDRATIFLLPGVPRELDGLLESEVTPWLASRSDGVGWETAVLKVACLSESALEERLQPVYETWGSDNITVLASPGEIRIELRQRGSASERAEVLAAMSHQALEAVGDVVFSRDAEETLPQVVVAALRRLGRRVATAESCTGGMIAARLTEVAGSSEVFDGGLVAYANRVKVEGLGVPADVIEAHGAVSEPVARAMARGARLRFGADYGIGVTGVAGPGGGTSDKPVGLVHIAVAGPGDELHHRDTRFPGSRERVRTYATQWALDMLRRRLSGAS